MGLKNKIKLIKEVLSVPKGVVASGLSQVVYFYNNSAAAMNENDVEWVSRELRILTHTIEKGLSLPIVRKGFGKEKIKSILTCLDKYIEIGNFSYDNEAFTGAIAILERYVAEADKYRCDISFIDLNKYSEYYKNDIEEYGVREGSDLNTLYNLNKVDFETFAKARHSIRSFSERPLDAELVKRAVKLAQTAPSACNRQSTRIIHVKDKELCKQILDIQGGSKGHSVSELLLVASDLHLYRHTSEIGTPYLDGGIFVMNLLYALTYYGIGSCPLIWNDYGDRGTMLRKILNIQKNMHIVSVIQIGEYPENGFNYAISARKAAEDVYIPENDVII